MLALSSVLTFVLLVLAAPAGAAVSTGHSGWLWGSPEPQGHHLQALELQGGTGYAAGDFGTLLRTNDGGTGWGTVRTGQTLDFTEIDMIDADSLVVASPCAARRTDNAGESFRRLPFTTSERQCHRRLRALSFPTADVGYLLLEDGGVLRTSDGGRSFSPRTLVPADPAGFTTALAFRNADNGIATTTAGGIFRTTDGGDTWTREFNGTTELHGVLFTDSRAVAVGNAATFLVSSDNGDTWTRPASEPGAPTPPPADFLDVRCASATVCLMTSRASGILRTADNGRSFTETDTTNAVALDYASETRAVAVGFGGETHLSDDGGASFAQLGARNEGATGLLRVRATSTSVAHAVGDGGALVRTVDGGETWDNVGVPTSSGLVDVWFPTDAVGYALDFGGGLFRTENGGSSWSILETGAGAPNGVFAPDASNVFLIGPRGVLRSTDGGENFERHTHPIIRNRTLQEADKAGSSVVFFGPRVIALSTNDGDTWRRIPRPTSRAEVMHVDFLSSRVGYVLETDGRLYFTRNRGRSWTERIGTGYSGARIAFGDRRNGWLVLTSAHPTVLRTTDGGNSWKPQILGPQPVISLAAAGAQTGFAAVMEPARILFTQEGGDAGEEATLRLSTPDRAVLRGKKIEITGRLSPAEGGEDVEVRVRRLTGRNWREIDVTPNRQGRFTIEQRIRRAMVFVAQWEGDADSDGDGTRPLVVQAQSVGPRTP